MISHKLKSKRLWRDYTRLMIISKLIIMRGLQLNLARLSSMIKTVIEIIIFYLYFLVPEVYAERAEIYIKLCDFSSAISNFKKAIS